MGTDRTEGTFLADAPGSAADAMRAGALADDGYVANYIRVWAWRPDVMDAYAAFRGVVVGDSSLTERDLAVLVTSMASQRGDSYCSLAWGTRLSRLTDPDAAAQVISGGEPVALTARESALATWARQVVRDPNATTHEDVERLRAVGLDDRAIFEATAFVALRLAFSSINDALGARPDKELVDRVPAPVRDAVTYGRRPMTTAAD